ncbi:inner membrane protein [Cooperia oncophora]
MLSVPRVALRRGLIAVELSSRATFYCNQQVRHISSKDIFNYATQAAPDVPAMPLPPPPMRTVEEMVEAGESVLGELGLLSWWKPSSYFRMALEGIHMHADLPWWTTIVCATVALRLSLIIVPIMSQRLVAKQSRYKKELEDFRQRIQAARQEGNNLLQQQIFLEQRDFLKAKDIRLGRQFLILLANGGVFATQFFAIRKMVDVNYPGLSTGGTAWFTDLTVADPYYALPLISAVTMGLVTRVGIEMGTSADQMTPTMRIGMQYALPVVIFAISSQFASGLCVYWCASNMMSLLYAGAFRTPAIRKIFNIPPIVVDPTARKKKNAFKEVMAGYKANKAIPPTLAQLKERDAQQFKKAGRGKPIVKS